MSPTMSKYRKLGLELVSLEDNRSHTPKKPSMVEEKKNDGADDPINLLLEQALTRQRDEMMENFSHILQCLPITAASSSSSGHFGGTSPFKVQVNFDILVFEGQIDASVHNFFDKVKITFTLLKSLPHVKHWWETYWEKISTEESGKYGVDPTWDFFVDAVKEQYYPVANYEDQYMRWTTLQQEIGQASSKVHQYLPYLTHQSRYQRLRATFGSEIPWGSTQCWLWSLIIFLIQRSFLSAMFIPHEVFTPQKYVHSSTWGSAERGYPLCEVRGGKRGFQGEALEGKIVL
jgi:hypothetical protein